MPDSRAVPRHSAPACAYDRCGRAVTQAFDIWSWHRDYRAQTPTHYEVCDDHADLFANYTGRTDDSKTFLVRNRCQPTPLSDDEIRAAKVEITMRGVQRV